MLSAASTLLTLKYALLILCSTWSSDPWEIQQCRETCTINLNTTNVGVDCFLPAPPPPPAPCSPPPPSSSTIVLIAAGQSNMVGMSNDGVPFWSQTPYATPFVTQLGRYNGQDWKLIEAVDLLDFPEQGIGHSQAITAGYSTWLHTGQNVTLIPCAWGGTGFTGTPNWMPVNMSAGPPANYSLYYDCTNRTNYVLSQPGYSLGGILWDQGEQEATEGVSGDVWLGYVENLVTSWRSDLIGGDKAPFVAVQMVPSYVAQGGADWLSIQAAINSIPFRIPFSATVYGLDSWGGSLATGDDGGIHYNTQSQEAIGFHEWDAIVAAKQNYPGSTTPGQVLQVFVAVVSATEVNISWVPDPVATSYVVTIMDHSEIVPAEQNPIMMWYGLSWVSYEVTVVSVGLTGANGPSSAPVWFSTACHNPAVIGEGCLGCNNSMWMWTCASCLNSSYSGPQCQLTSIPVSSSSSSSSSGSVSGTGPSLPGLDGGYNPTLVSGMMNLQSDLLDIVSRQTGINTGVDMLNQPGGQFLEVPGRGGSAFELDQTAHGVVSPQSAQLQPSFTMSLWFIVLAVADYDETYLVSSTQLNKADSSFWLSVTEHNNVLQFGAGNTSTPLATVGLAASIIDTWYHVIVSYNASTTRSSIYINGTLLTSTPSPNAATWTGALPSNGMMLGGNPFGDVGYTLRGALQCFKWSDVEWTPSVATYVYQQEEASNGCTGLVDYNNGAITASIAVSAYTNTSILTGRMDMQTSYLDLVSGQIGTGTSGGNVLFSSTAPMGYSWSSDGSGGQHGTAPAAAAPLGVSYAVSVWINPTDVQGGTVNYIISSATLYTPTTFWLLITPSFQMQFGCGPSSSALASVATSSSSLLNAWTHIVVAYETSTSTIYINGTLAAQKSNAAQGWMGGSSSNGFILGYGYSDISYTYTGSMRCIKWSNTPWTTAMVSSVFANELNTGYCDGMAE